MPNTKNQWELVDWPEFYQMARDLSFLIRDDNYQPDIIIAIARGGYTPARILSDYLGIMDMTSFKVRHYHSKEKTPVARIEHPLAADVSGCKVLLVDDVSDTGDTFDVAIEHIQQTTQPAQIRSAVLHHKTVSSYTPDYYTREVVEWHWITYPWAAIEDLSAYIRKLQPRPQTVTQLAEQLKKEHSLQPPQQLLHDAMLLCDQVFT